MPSKLSLRFAGPVAVLCLGAVAAAMPQPQSGFMPVDQVQPGMVGTGRTVYGGNQLDEFRANILGVLRNVIAPGRDLILAKLEGGPLATAGVMQGMSGSPVYIDGRLVGAVSYSLGSFPKEAIAGITPIAEMISAVSDQAPSRGDAEFQLPWPSATPEQVFAALGRLVGRAAVPLRSPLQASDIVGAPSLADWAPRLRPIGAAMVMAGLAPGIASSLRDVMPGATSPAPATGPPSQAPPSRTDPPLRPGDPVGMSLVRGDMEMGATGTVTYVDGPRVYAFGHPFLNMGPTSMAMTRAQVLTVLPSLDSSMKIASMGPVIGRMTQDRSTGVGGVLGSGPDELDLSLTIESPRAPARQLHFQILHDQSLTPLFAYVAILNALIAHDRQTGGSAVTARGTLTFDGLGTLPIDDAFSGEQAIAQAGAAVMNPIGALAANAFRSVLPRSLDLTVTVSEGEDFATIERVWLDTTRPTFGGTHTVHVMLRRYRGGTEVVSLPITMPRQATGPVTVLVSDGPTLAALEQKELTPAAPATLDALFARLGQTRAGNRLFVRVLTAAQGTAVAGESLPSLPPSVLAALGADGSVAASAIGRTVAGAWSQPMPRVVRGSRELTVTLRPAVPSTRP